MCNNAEDPWPWLGIPSHYMMHKQSKTPAVLQLTVHFRTLAYTSPAFSCVLLPPLRKSHCGRVPEKEPQDQIWLQYGLSCTRDSSEALARVRAKRKDIHLCPIPEGLIALGPDQNPGFHKMDRAAIFHRKKHHLPIIFLSESFLIPNLFN